MKENKSKLKKSQKKKLGAIFLKVVTITFVVCLAIVGAAAGAYKFFIYDDAGKDAEKTKSKTLFKPKDINKTLAVFGVDKDGFRTDVIFVVNYNSKTNKAKIVSVPRDTKVEWTDAQQQKLQEYKGTSISTSKINEMTSYGGIENIRAFTVDEIQNILGIEVDNYVIVTIDAFRQVVDAIDGVEVNVPELEGRGLQYDDSAQDLHIHLDPGPQVLNGKDAEGLVRYRKGNNGTGYAEGDVGRIKTQQLFLEAFAKKLLSPGILTKLPQIVPVIFTSIKTDMDLTEIPQYYSYLKKFDLTNLSFNIIPGEAVHENKWYFVADREKMKPFVDEVFYDKVPEGAADIVTIDKAVAIEVLNATNIKGAAGETKNTLENLGYNVASIDNYDQNDVQNTIIYAKDVSKAKQFKEYFEAAAIEQNNDINYDIQIILGEDVQ